MQTKSCFNPCVGKAFGDLVVLHSLHWNFSCQLNLVLILAYDNFLLFREVVMLENL
ncbi:MAG TPA: hypothetical protein HA229_01140 [Nanoarchaeota archaeon]|nr:hypothetical protein [Nanoarchaeota archaeon]